MSELPGAKITTATLRATERAKGFEPSTPTLASGKLRRRHVRLR